MAPAAKANIIGKIIWILKTIKAPINAAIGSTKALKTETIKDFFDDKPEFLIGKLKAAPSGKFCNAIPRVNEKAEIKFEIELS